MLVVSIGAPDEQFPGATGFSERIHPGKLTAASEERIQTAIPSCADSPSFPSGKLQSHGPHDSQPAATVLTTALWNLLKWRARGCRRPF
jgi:hypothetical protein